MRNRIITIVVVGFILAALALLILSPAVATQPNRVPVTICHDANGNGNTGNGYNLQTVDASSIVTEGHTSHGGGLYDLIPPFTYFEKMGKGKDATYVEKYFPGQGDYSLIATDCAKPTGTPTGTPTDTPTGTPTGTPPVETPTVPVETPDTPGVDKPKPPVVDSPESKDEPVAVPTAVDAGI